MRWPGQQHNEDRCHGTHGWYQHCSCRKAAPASQRRDTGQVNSSSHLPFLARAAVPGDVCQCTTPQDCELPGQVPRVLAGYNIIAVSSKDIKQMQMWLETAECTRKPPIYGALPLGWFLSPQPAWHAAVPRRATEGIECSCVKAALQPGLTTDDRSGFMQLQSSAAAA
jgi:hypothetical protein